MLLFFIIQIDEVFSVQKVGPVLAGTLRSGTIHEGDEIMVGPTEDGLFNEVTVSSIHRNRTPCRIIQAGQTACIAVKPTPHFDQTFRRVRNNLDTPLFATPFLH